MRSSEFLIYNREAYVGTENSSLSRLIVTALRCCFAQKSAHAATLTIRGNLSNQLLLAEGLKPRLQLSPDMV
jgi:hypothetical protein